MPKTLDFTGFFSPEASLLGIIEIKKTLMLLNFIEISIKFYTNLYEFFR